MAESPSFRRSRLERERQQRRETPSPTENGESAFVRRVRDAYGSALARAVHHMSRHRAVTRVPMKTAEIFKPWDAEPLGAHVEYLTRVDYPDLIGRVFRWPEAGYVESPLWYPTPGGPGLYGVTEGKFNTHKGPVSRVFAVNTFEVVHSDIWFEKKVPRAWVVFCGSYRDADSFLHQRRQDKRRRFGPSPFDHLFEPGELKAKPL